MRKFIERHGKAVQARNRFGGFEKGSDAGYSRHNRDLVAAETGRRDFESQLADEAECGFREAASTCVVNALPAAGELRVVRAQDALLPLTLVYDHTGRLVSAHCG